MARENLSQEEVERVSGTLDAVAAYIGKKFDLKSLGPVKAATLLWLDQECELADMAKNSELNVGLKSLADFGDEGSKAQGMVADSRVFINVNKAMATALASIPAEIIESILCQNDIDKTGVKILLNVADSFGRNAATIPDGLACACMRAWHYTKGQKHIPFQAKDIMPGREYPHDETSCLTCDLTHEDGRQRLGHAKWECPYHESGNYCGLDEEKVRQMLDVLEQQGILIVQGQAESLNGKSYLFL